MVIVGAVFSFMSSEGSKFPPLISLFASTNRRPSYIDLLFSPFSFLLILTFFAFFINLRWIYAFENHRERVDIIIKEIVKSTWPQEIGIPDLTMSIPKMKILPEGVDNLNEFFRTRFYFPIFYFSILIYLVLRLVVPFLPFRSFLTWSLAVIAILVFVVFPLYSLRRFFIFFPSENKKNCKSDTARNQIK
jgi:hypothetical protein